ncbi:MAG: hypothetical protein R3F11_03455 [Verrucomicrobiales bacterium]
MGVLTQRAGGWKRHIGKVSHLTHPDYHGLYYRVPPRRNHRGGKAPWIDPAESEINGERESAIKAMAAAGFQELVRLPDYIFDMNAQTHDFVLMGMELIPAFENLGGDFQLPGVAQDFQSVANRLVPRLRFADRQKNGWQEYSRQADGLVVRIRGGAPQQPANAGVRMPAWDRRRSVARRSFDPKSRRRSESGLDIGRNLRQTVAMPIDYPDPVRLLIAHLKALPGIGPRSAERIAIWMLQGGGRKAPDLARAIDLATSSIAPCPTCGFFSESGKGCALCEGADVPGGTRR